MFEDGLKGKRISFGLTPIKPVDDWQAEAETLANKLQESIQALQMVIQRRTTGESALAHPPGAETIVTIKKPPGSTPEAWRKTIAGILEEAAKQNTLATKAGRGEVAAEIDQALRRNIPFAERIDRDFPLVERGGL